MGSGSGTGVSECPPGLEGVGVRGGGAEDAALGSSASPVTLFLFCNPQRGWTWSVCVCVCVCVCVRACVCKVCRRVCCEGATHLGLEGVRVCVCVHGD